MLKTSSSCSTCGSLRSDSYVTKPKPAPALCKLMEGKPCSLCQELEEFDIGYQAILEGLVEQRRKILQRINERHDPFIQRLPPELASQVFTSCLPRQEFESDPLYISLLWDDSKDSSIMPFNIVLGSICQSWRRIAWSTPKLWSTLPVMLHRCDKQTRVDLTLEWLSRSAQVPLEVAVAYDSEAASEKLTQVNIGLWKPLIDIVNGCSSRWRILIVDVPELVHSYIVGNGEATSILECLKFGNSDFGIRRSSTGFSLANALPTPSKLTSSAVSLRSIVIGWSNLTVVKITYLYVNECLLLFQRAHRLTAFKIEQLLQGQDEILPAPSPTIHHTLQSFNIFELVEKQSAEKLLDFLTLPSLVDLSYDSSYNSLENVSAFLQRSGCKLAALRVMIEDPDHFSGLALTSGLQSLEKLVYFGDVDGLLLCLEKPPNEQDGSLILPNLHRIKIWDDHMAWSALADLFLSRPLKTLSMRLQTPIQLRDKISWVDKETTFRFQNLIKMGHEIKIMGIPLGESGKARDLLPWYIEARTQESGTVH